MQLLPRSCARWEDEPPDANVTARSNIVTFRSWEGSNFQLAMLNFSRISRVNTADIIRYVKYYTFSLLSSNSFFINAVVFASIL